MKSRSTELLRHRKRVFGSYRAKISTLRYTYKPVRQTTAIEAQDLNAMLGQFMGQQQTIIQGISEQQNVRLPNINIEPFDGDYKAWPFTTYS